MSIENRLTYALTAENVSIIRRALAARSEDVQADPDYADDERSERLDAIKEAVYSLDVADYQRERVERLLRPFGQLGPHGEERRSGPGRRATDLPGTPSERAREVERGVS